METINMGLIEMLIKKDKIFDFDYSPIHAVCDGELILPEKIQDEVFSKSLIGKTIAIEPSEGTIVAPCSGVLEVVFPTGHAFALRANDGTGILVHIGINTVSLKGEGYKTLRKTGEEVKAGDPIVKVDIDKIKEKNLHPTTMIVISEPAGGRKYNYIDCGAVTKGQIISK